MTLRPMTEFPHGRAEETHVYLRAKTCYGQRGAYAGGVERAACRNAEHDPEAVGWVWRHEVE